jgi:hypothetical protein
MVALLTGFSPASAAGQNAISPGVLALPPSGDVWMPTHQAAYQTAYASENLKDRDDP